MPSAVLPSPRSILFEGMRDGMPIAFGYFVVSFTLGIAAKNAGLSVISGAVSSLLNLASAGQFAGYTTIAADAPYLEIALITFVANARYMLMTCVLSQKFAPDTPFLTRCMVGYGVSDEIFGITVARPGYIIPLYNYGAMLVAIPGWTIGTAIGVFAGDVLPGDAVSALSVTLYGMFLWIILPAAKKDKVVAVLVGVSFAMSFLCNFLPIVSDLSGGTRTILLTLLIAGAGAYFRPLQDIPKIQSKEECKK